MKTLDIPLHLQKEGSADCGPVSSAMILDYYGVTSNVAEVIKKVPRCNFGTSSFDNANTLMDYGLSVELVTAHPKIFDGDFIRSNPNKDSILLQIEKVLKKEKDKERKDILASLIKFVKRGGVLRIQIPTKALITESIDQNKPVWISVQANTLGINEGGYHTVVVGGYSDNQLQILNPWPLSRKKSWEDTEAVLFGIHSSTLFDYDNGAILIVSK